MEAKKYNAKDIVVLEGLDAVRLRPGMYIGTTGSKGLHHLLWEIVDNAIDEIANGYGNKIAVTLHTDGSASVVDDGRGVPTDKHPKLKISGVEVVFTQLHAGGKFESQNYQYSGGLHGVGASVTNALSEWCEVFVDRDGKRYNIRFESIPDEKGHIMSGHTVKPLEVVGESKSTGTLVRFKPDKRVFGDVTFDYNVVANRLKELAFLNKGIEILLIDERVDKDKKPVVKQFKYVGGIADFITNLTEAKTKLYEKPFYVCGESDRMKVEASFIHTSEYSETMLSYVNNIPTSEGGTHETGLRSAITRMFNETARKLNLLKDKDENLLGEDFREGLTCVLTVKMRNVQFEGQTKTKLGNPEAKPEVENIVCEELAKVLVKNDSKKSFEAIIEKAKGAAKVREAAKKAKEHARQVNSAEQINLVGKLANCSGKKPELNELYIVEGKSAGGSAKQGRDRFFQAILPLRGKPLNVEKTRLEQALQNEEIRTIIGALGTGISPNFNLDNLKFHKVVILADADQDGEHIKCILLTFFYRYMRELILNGHVYLGMPPLYKVYNKSKTLYAYTDADLEEKKKQVGRGYQIQRYKGLGEMNPEQLWETTLNPKNRFLVKVTIDDAFKAEQLITTLMGDNIEARKKYIAEYADFNRVDNFRKTGDEE
ncbi:MAG: DNA gyrase subunit B [Clostridiales bacterium]|nr:DNA gyrase subunit B [Candidatus Apopatousia equi]